MRQAVIVGRKLRKALHIGVCVRHFILKLAQLLLHGKDLLIHLLQLVPDGFTAGHHVLLRQIADAQAADERNLAAVLCIQPRENAHERRFAAAVYAHKADSIALLHGQGDVAQHSVDAEGLGDMLGG